jgi:hypothetical protein
MKKEGKHEYEKSIHGHLQSPGGATALDRRSTAESNCSGMWGPSSTGAGMESPRAGRHMPSLFERGQAIAKLQTDHKQEREQLYAEIGKLTTHVNWLKKRPVDR